MKKMVVLLCVLLLWPTVQPQSQSQPVPAAATAAAATTIVLADEPLRTDAERIGLNLGEWTSWGAEQLSRNVLKNPGFEGVIDRSLVRVQQPSAGRFNDDERWLAREDGFWIGADATVLTGSAAGHSAAVIDSRASGANNLPEYRLDTVIPGLAAGDMVALTRVRDDLPPSHWWFSAADTGVISAIARPRPDSAGSRAVLLAPHSGKRVAILSYLDMLYARAGKLLPVQGGWNFSIWAFAETAATLTVRFRRGNAAALLERQFTLAAGWQQLDADFTGNDDGADGPLQLALEVSGGRVVLDDAWLGPALPAGLAQQSLARMHFNPQAIELLAVLQPGYLRDWQGQLGDTLANRLAAPAARRASRYRPGDADFFYGLPEFLDLCLLVGAQPWLVIPTTFSQDEAEALGRWLHTEAERAGFREILIEFGNENWNSVFRPAGIADAAVHGEAADRLFAALRKGAGNDARLKTVINAQHANPYAALKTARASGQADVLALAPYLASRLEAGDRAAVLQQLFADDGGRLREILAGRPQQQELAVYEVNLHATRGNLPLGQRNAVVTSAAAGSALAQRLLQTMLAGVKRQNVYTFAGFDTYLHDSRELTRLFGITRNLAGVSSLRPTGVALQLLNRAVQPQLHTASAVAGPDPLLTVAGFAGARGWTLALVSAHPAPRQVALQFPDDGRALPQTALVLDGSGIALQAEVDAPVSPLALPVAADGARTVVVTVPAYSLVVLE